ncbi:MAG TPA: hypothetical protein VHX38_02430 [Pseudonocardiaceae bacterium]|nr:hypothetical protein [Pseudonocardiaceae bacterium]
MTARWELDVPLVVPGTTGKLQPLSANDRLHWRIKAGHVATIRTGVAWRAKEARIPPQDHITVQLHYAPGDSIRRDASNLTATQKPAVDGLVDARVVPDDTAAWVTELMPVLHLRHGSFFRVRRLWLVVEATERAA